jgi:hypothetical protein
MPKALFGQRCLHARREQAITLKPLRLAPINQFEIGVLAVQ